MPEPAGCHSAQAGNAEKPQGKTTNDKPKPAASAALAQLPEPRPQKQSLDLAEGNKPSGHGKPGKTIKPEPGRVAALSTIAIERAANELGPVP